MKEITFIGIRGISGGLGEEIERTQFEEIVSILVNCGQYDAILSPDIQSIANGNPSSDANWASEVHDMFLQKHDVDPSYLVDDEIFYKSTSKALGTLKNLKKIDQDGEIKRVCVIANANWWRMMLNGFDTAVTNEIENRYLKKPTAITLELDIKSWDELDTVDNQYLTEAFAVLGFTQNGRPVRSHTSLLDFGGFGDSKENSRYRRREQRAKILKDLKPAYPKPSKPRWRRNVPRR